MFTRINLHVSRMRTSVLFKREENQYGCRDSTSSRSKLALTVVLMDEGESKLDSPISFQICFDSMFSTTSINYRNKSLTVLDFHIQMMSDKNKCVKRGEFISHWKCFLTNINLQIQTILLYNLMPCYKNNISRCKVTQKQPLPAYDLQVFLLSTWINGFCC